MKAKFLCIFFVSCQVSMFLESFIPFAEKFLSEMAAGPSVVEVDGDEDKEDCTVRLKNNPVHDHFEYSSISKKSTCKICKVQLAGKNPTSLGK
jgi:hypothetical protein